MIENTNKEKCLNLFTDEDCKKIYELSKKPELNLKNCNHSNRYYGLNEEERKKYKEDIGYLEKTFKKIYSDFINFSNFTGQSPNKIRCQVWYDDAKSFQGVCYLNLPTNNSGEHKCLE